MNPFIGEVRAISFAFAPEGWLRCDGTVYSVVLYRRLFDVIGSTYGGNGTTTFAIPNLMGAALVGQGQGRGLTNYALNESAGVRTVALTTDQIAAHNHPAVARVERSGTTNMHGVPAAGDHLSRFAGAAAPGSAFNNPPLVDADTFLPGMIQPSGAGEAHENQQPFLAMVYCIATQGIFPRRN